MADRLKGYTGDVAIKVPCRLATTAAITLSGEQTIDGVAAVAGDRVLVKNQTDTTTNGIYIASTGAWVRSADWDGARDVVNGTQTSVVLGTVSAGLFYTASCTDPFTVGATAVTFTSSAIPTSSAAAASASAAAALVSQNAALASANAADVSEAAALASANAADVSEAAALASANAADVSEANALASANAAGVSEAAALASEVAAAASAAAAAAIEIATPTHAAPSKITPVDADELPLADSAATFGLKKLTWANLKTVLAAACSAGWNAATATNVTGSAVVTGAISSSSPTAGIGYATGAGGSVTQTTSITTPVTLNKMSGKIILVNHTYVSGTSYTFQLNNTNLAIGDTLVWSGGAAAFIPVTRSLTTGNAQILLYSIANLTDIYVVNFAIVKGVEA